MLLPLAKPAANMEVDAAGPTETRVARAELAGCHRLHRRRAGGERAGHHETRGPGKPPRPRLHAAGRDLLRHAGEGDVGEWLREIEGRRLETSGSGERLGCRGDEAREGHDDEKTR